MYVEMVSVEQIVQTVSDICISGQLRVVCVWFDLFNSIHYYYKNFVIISDHEIQSFTTFIAWPMLQNCMYRHFIPFVEYHCVCECGFFFYSSPGPMGH